MQGNRFLDARVKQAAPMASDLGHVRHHQLGRFGLASSRPMLGVGSRYSLMLHVQYYIYIYVHNNIHVWIDRYQKTSQPFIEKT